MTVPVLKMVVAAVLLLLTMATTSAVRTDYVLGCKPKLLARDMAIYCLQPINAPMPMEPCCAVAVGTVARPSCYCRVKQEPAFAMTKLRNTTNMSVLLAMCGASVHLNYYLHSSCDKPDIEKEATNNAPPEKASEPANCKNFKVSTYVGFALVFMFGGAVLFLALLRSAPRKQVVYLPETQLVQTSMGSNNQEQSPVLSDASPASSDTGNNLIQEGKRKRNPNPKYIGNSWLTTGLCRRPKKHRG